MNAPVALPPYAVTVPAPSPSPTPMGTWTVTTPMSAVPPAGPLSPAAPSPTPTGTWAVVTPTLAPTTAPATTVSRWAVFPLEPAASSAPARAARTAVVRPAVRQPPRRRHVVRPAHPCTTWLVGPGDTLWGISQACDTTVDAILRANPEIQHRDLIYVGQRFTIPGGK